MPTLDRLLEACSVEFSHMSIQWHGLYGPCCPLSPERPLNLITHSPPIQWHCCYCAKYTKVTHCSPMKARYGVSFVISNDELLPCALSSPSPGSMKWFLIHCTAARPGYIYCDGSVQDCSNSIDNAQGSLQSCVSHWYTIMCCFNVVQYDMIILQTSLQWLKENTDHSLNPPKTLHTWP